MPIKFRCRHCRQFLGISRSRAGEITDCPMCGKTIRVPNLDGSVDPIPTPELDLEDSQLVAALGELAGIGKTPSPHEVSSPPKFLATHDETVIQPSAQPVPCPQPIPVQPAKSIANADSETIIQAAEDGATVVQDRDPLQVLAESASRRPPVHPGEGHAGSRRSARVLGASAAGVLILAGVLWFGGGDEPGPPVLEASAERSTTVEPARAADRPGREQTPAVAPGASTVQGRVTYVAENGATLPDVGASVLLLPQSKKGAVRLDVAGFLAGAEPVDVGVARAAIRALGGDVATADDAGRYGLTVPATGDYHLLAISRHAARDPAEVVSGAVQEVLAAYFFRPASLLGSLRFDFEPLQATGSEPGPRDFLFSND